MKQLLILGLAVGCTLSAGVTRAEIDAQVEQQVKQRLSAAVPGLEISSISESPFDGIYTVETTGREILFTNADGSHLLVGELYKVSPAGVVNVSEQRRAKKRAKRIKAVPPEEMITFRPEGPVKAVINVFTDIDCPYCRKLHADVPALNELGVQVNYLAFPRSGPNTPSFAKAVSAWCSADPAKAITRAKQGRSLPEKNCENPVAEQFALGQEIGITGTPAIVLEDGRLIGGYVPKDRLAQALGL